MKFYRGALDIALEGNVFQNFDLGFSFYFIPKNG